MGTSSRAKKTYDIRTDKGTSNFVEKNYKYFLLIFIGIFLGLSFYGAYSDSFCCDEHLYTNVTYNYFHTFNVLTLRDTPYLLHVLNVVPVMLMDHDGYYPNKDITAAIHDTGIDFRSMILLMRLPSILLGIFLIYYLYLFASKLFNKSAGLLAVFFVCH